MPALQGRLCKIGQHESLARVENTIRDVPQFLSFHKMYIRLAAERARVQPARLSRASSRLARAIVAKNFDFRFLSARFMEATVGWRSSCEPTDCGAVNPAFGLFAD